MHHSKPSLIPIHQNIKIHQLPTLQKRDINKKYINNSITFTISSIGDCI